MPYSIHIGGKDAYVARIAGMLRSAGASAAIVPDELQEAIGEAAARAGDIPVSSFSALAQLAEHEAELKPFRPDETAYIQYSSGSTSSPKGVLISQKAISANAEGILRHDGDDVSMEKQVNEMMKNQQQHNLAIGIMSAR